jgi:hypothetical protein
MMFYAGASLVYVLSACIAGTNNQPFNLCLWLIGISASLHYNVKLWNHACNVRENSKEALKRVNINQFVNEHWIEQD